MEHLETNIGVYGLVIKEKKLLLLHKPNDVIWCALGGRMDKDDLDPGLTLQREVEEEIGCEIIVGDILDVKLWSIGGENKRLGIFYVCRLKDENKEFKLSSEHDDYKFFSFDEASEMWKQKDRGSTGIELGTKLKEKGWIN
jgi:8-oxo-dGTP pyrophosphatase MutT (NUDIX family)